MEAVQFFTKQGKRIREVDFTKGGGRAWTLLGQEPLQHYQVSEFSLQKMAADGLDLTLIEEVSTLVDRFFSTKTEFHAALKQLPHPPGWKKRAIIRRHTKLFHYDVQANNIWFISPHFTPILTSQVDLRFRAVIPTNLQTWFFFGYRKLSRFWWFFLIGSMGLGGVVYAQWTGNRWHLD